MNDINLDINDIFNNSFVVVGEKRYPLKFSISAELFLEEQGLSVLTLSKALLEKPVHTSLLLAFAGLPREQFRDKMSFEDFRNNLTDIEGRKIHNQINVLCEAYFKHLLGKIKESNKEQPTTKTAERGVKKNLFQSFYKWLSTPVGLFRK